MKPMEALAASKDGANQLRFLAAGIDALLFIFCSAGPISAMKFMKQSCHLPIQMRHLMTTKVTVSTERLRPRWRNPLASMNPITKF
ncbi:MAG: hypothetical protein ACI8T1_002631 [Verrucomicrobiales bacterium]|jgi:hypothetical protein